MFNRVMMIVVAAIVAATSNPAVAMSAGGAGADVSGVSVGKSPLDKTWTTGGQENEACSQVLAVTLLTSPVSFQAEGKGFEPSTGCPAPDFETGGEFS
jgi:hypothetical protein